MNFRRCVLAFAVVVASAVPAFAFERGEVWTGTYSYGDGRPSVSFTLFVTGSGNDRFRGVVVEPNTLGDRRAQLLYADFEGRQTGANITFTKTYDGTAGVAHGVLYEGRIAGGIANGNWHIGNDSGSFSLARR